MAQQSAVEFILVKILDGDWESTPWPKRREIIEQAKQMEKEQIINAQMDMYHTLIPNEFIILNKNHRDNAEKYSQVYYNETYNK